MALPVGSGLMRYDTVVLLSATLSAWWTNKSKRARGEGVCVLSLSYSYSAAKKRSLTLSISAGPPWIHPSPKQCYWQKRQLQPHCTEITFSQRNQLAFRDKPDCWRSSSPHQLLYGTNELQRKGMDGWRAGWKSAKMANKGEKNHLNWKKELIWTQIFVVCNTEYHQIGEAGKPHMFLDWLKS